MNNAQFNEYLKIHMLFFVMFSGYCFNVFYQKRESPQAISAITPLQVIFLPLTLNKPIASTHNSQQFGKAICSMHL